MPGANKSAALIKADTETPAIIDGLEQEIKKMKHIEDSAYKCPKDMEGFGPVQTETKIENLIRAYSNVSKREEYYNEAAVTVQHAAGLQQVPVFTLGGCSADAWREDIILRINIIYQKERLDKLKEFKDDMKKFLSEQDQKTALVNEIKAFLGK